METKIEKIGGKNKVTMSYKGQSFTLDSEGRKDELEWFKNRLDDCINIYTQDIVAFYKPSKPHSDS